MKNFESLGLDPVLADSLARMKYDTPTPIQAQAIPIALSGRDVMGSAQTGTGKTAAYSIPLVEALLRSDSGCGLVLTPTRELGKQVMEIITQLLGPKSYINTAFLIGGEHMGKQLTQLRRKPRLIVGTPGRVTDHLERGSLNLSDAKFLVLDETDRMLDMGFSVQLDRILEYVPSERQTLMFSATLPSNIIKLSNKYLINPERVAVGSTRTPIENINQEIAKVTTENKYDVLLSELEARSGSVIIFVKTKRNTEKLAQKLAREGHDAEAIHGDLKQSRRDRVIKGFRNSQYRILVATDVVARGLDIPHIEHVINYDLPQVAEDYIHRIGRTARAGKKGHALCLISPQDGRKWNDIERLMNPEKYPDNDSQQERDRGGRKGGSRKNFGRGGGKKFEGKPRGKSGNKPWEKSGGKAERGGERKEWPKKKAAGPSDRPQRDGEKKSWDKKPHNRSERDGEKKSWDKKPHNRSERDGEKKSWDKKPHNRSERDGEKKSWDKKPHNRSERDGEKKSWDKKPHNRSERDGEKKSWDKKPAARGERDGAKREWKKPGDKRTERSNSWKTPNDRTERGGHEDRPAAKPARGKSGGGDKPWKKKPGGRPNNGPSGKKRVGGDRPARHKG